MTTYHNPIGIHAQVWVGDWSPASARKACASSVEAGYDLIELPVSSIEEFDPVMTAAIVAEYGLKMGASLGLQEHSDISSEDDAAVQAGRAVLREALSLVRDCGGTYLGGVIYGKLGRYTAKATPRGRANSMAVIAELADEAAASGITLGLEFCNRYETNLMNTTAETLAYIDEVGRDNVVAHLDCYHMNIEENSFRDAVLAASAAGKLGYVHVGESHRGYLGTGSIPWAEFFGALHEVNYQGPITFESFSSEVVQPVLSRNLCIWRNLWTDSMDLARSAREFIRENYGA